VPKSGPDRIGNSADVAWRPTPPAGSIPDEAQGKTLVRGAGRTSCEQESAFRHECSGGGESWTDAARTRSPDRRYGGDKLAPNEASAMRFSLSDPAQQSPSPHVVPAGRPHAPDSTRIPAGQRWSLPPMPGATNANLCAGVFRGYSTTLRRGGQTTMRIPCLKTTKLFRNLQNGFVNSSSTKGSVAFVRDNASCSPRI
jgi:hypothetical protein